jgi:ubiquitin-conjugating enzyme E2 J2
MKPPSIYMLTPNGRFQTDTRLCLSMSDFHPETWNPLWSVSTILMGLYAFMLESSPTAGSIETSDAFKRRCARESWEFNTRHKLFRELFPELTEEMEELMRTQPPLGPAAQSSQSRHKSSEAASCTQLLISFAVVAGLLAICLHLS